MPMKYEDTMKTSSKITSKRASYCTVTVYTVQLPQHPKVPNLGYWIGFIGHTRILNYVLVQVCEVGAPVEALELVSMVF